MRSLVLAGLALLLFTSLAAAQEPRHVIVMCDASGSVGQKISSRELRDRYYVQALGQVLFDAPDGQRHLYDPQHDAISIFWFGIPSKSSSMLADYITPWWRLQVGKALPRTALHRLAREIPYDREYTLMTLAPFMGLRNAHRDGALYRDTYIVILTDDQLNGKKSEIADVANMGVRDTGIHQPGGALQIQSQILEHFAIQDMPGRQRQVNGAYIYIKQVIPSAQMQQQANEMVGRLPQVDALRQADDSYRMAQTLKTPAKNQALELVDVIASVVGRSGDRLCEPQTFTPSQKFLYTASFEPDKGARAVLDDWRLRICYRFRYNDGLYNNLTIEATDAPVVRMEPVKRVWWIFPIPARLLSWHGTQENVQRFWNPIGIAALVVAALFFGWFFFARPPMPDPESQYLPQEVEAYRDFRSTDAKPLLLGHLVLKDMATPRLFGRLRDFTLVKASIELLQSDPLVVEGTLFAFDRDGGQHMLKEQQVNREKSIPVYFRPVAISDCGQLDSNQVRIAFRIYTAIAPQTRGSKRQHTQYVNVTLVRAVPVAKALLGVVEEPINHSLGKSVRIGKVIVQCSCAVRYTHPLNLPLCVTLPKGELPWITLRPANADGVSPGNDKVWVGPLYSGDTQELDVVADFQVLPDPLRPEIHQFTIVADPESGQRIEPLSGQITVRPNPVFAWPLITIHHESCEVPVRCVPVSEPLPDPVRVSLPKIFWLRGSDIHDIAEIHIQNRAVTRGRGQVVALAAQAEWVVPPTIRQMDGGAVEVIRRGSLGTLMRQHLEIPNGEPAEVLEFVLRAAAIENLDTKCEDTRIELQFQGRATHSDQVREWQSPIIMLSFPLERSLGPFWLALDAGTSSLAAAFNDRYEGDHGLYGDGSFGMLDLATRFVNEPGHQRYGEGIEDDAPLLPAQTQLCYGGSLQSDILRLCPNLDELAQHPELALPFLKTIISLGSVPLDDQADFKYKDEHGKEQLQAPPVSGVVAAFYRLFLQSLVLKILSSEPHDRLNKAVIAVPNTFSPAQRTMVRTIVTKVSKGQLEHVEVISEPNAVACYYLKNWWELNEGRSEAERQRIADKEYVLVYDMGAGTLDLTYIQIDRVRSADQQADRSGPDRSHDIPHLTLLGELGKPSAGNNLDYRFARHIVEIVQSRRHETSEQASQSVDLSTALGNDRFNDESTAGAERRVFIPVWVDLMGGNPRDGHLRERLALRDAARELKHAYARMQPGQTYPLRITEIWPGARPATVDISYEDFAHWPELRGFVQANTEDLFGAFFSGLGERPGQVPIDTVILSGRSVQLPGLREKVAEALAKWTDPSRQVYHPEVPLDELKPAVVRGALAYVTTWGAKGIRFEEHRLSARYGFRYRGAHGRWHFLEFLGPISKPAGNGVYEAAHQIDVRETGVLELVRTHELSTGVVARTVDSSLTTRMAVYTKEEAWGAHPTVTLKLNPCEGFEVRINRVRRTGAALRASDLLEAAEYREGLWPLR